MPTDLPDDYTAARSHHAPATRPATVLGVVLLIVLALIVSGTILGGIYIATH